MKNYVNLTIDCADLISESATFAELHKIPSHRGQWLDWFLIPGFEEPARAAVPSFATTFDEFGLLPVRLNTYSSCAEGMWLDPVVPDRDHFVATLDNKPATIKFYEPNAGAERHSTNFYHLSDCTLVDETELTGPMMIKGEVPYVIEPTDPEDGPVILYVFFNELDSGLFTN